MTSTALEALSKLSRVHLAHLPTPLEPLPNLSKHLGGPELWIKRDDQTGLATGGNKARKLEYLMAQAVDEAADAVITAGSTQSNHARQTAAAAAKLGLECHLALYGPGAKPPEAALGNVLLDELLGAQIHWTEERAPYGDSIARIDQDLKALGKKPYVVPYGGSSPVGLMGYVSAMQELANQPDLPVPLDAVVFATSSGGMQSGVILGAHLTGWLGSVRLLGISVDARGEDLAERVANLVNQGAKLLGDDWRINDDVPDIDDSYLGGGYAVIGDPEREAIRLMARLEGILVDPVYTGRALAGLIDLIRRGKFTKGQRVLFWHTGGYAALFAYGDQLGLGEPSGAR